MQQNRSTGSVSHRFDFANSDVVDPSNVSVNEQKQNQRKLH